VPECVAGAGSIRDPPDAGAAAAENEWGGSADGGAGWADRRRVKNEK